MWASLDGADFGGVDIADAVRLRGTRRADLDGAKGLDTVKGLLD